jgi:hypothetical protein
MPKLPQIAFPRRPLALAHPFQFLTYTTPPMHIILQEERGVWP